MDIVVTMPKTEIDHWNEKITYSHIASERVWWNMKRLPTKLTSNDKVFVVMDGKVRGYFEIRYIERGLDNNENEISLKSYQEIQEITMKGFQGFRYRKFDYKIK